MDPIALLQSLWSHFLSLGTLDKVGAIGASLTILGIPFSIIDVLKSKERGMRFVFLYKLLMMIGYIYKLLMMIGYIVFAAGMLMQIWNPPPHEMAFVVEFTGLFVAYGAFIFKGRADREQKAYRSGTLKPAQPLASEPTASWPPAPANSEGS